MTKTTKAVMLRITPQLREALAALSEESGLAQAELADRMLTPLITLIQRYGWYRIIEELRAAAMTSLHPRKPGQKARGLRRQKLHNGVRASILAELLG